MSLILNIETSTKTCSVSLAKNGEEIHLKELTSDQYVHSEKLNAFIEELMNETEHSFSDLDAIAVTKGPGSYTGLRIGVSCAKGLCYALEIPLISIDSLTVMANHYLKQNDFDGIVIPTIDARRMEVYTASFDSKLNQLDEIRAEVVTEGSFQQFSDQNIHLIGDGAAKLTDVVQIPSLRIVDGFNTSASGMNAISFEKLNKKEVEDVAYFEPFYLKDFIAEKPKKREI